MTDVLEIYNLALLKLGFMPLASESASTREGQVCRLTYPASRDNVLELHEWKFAHRIEPLDLDVSASVPGWSFCYTYPIGCLRIRKIVPSTGDGPKSGAPFALFSSPGGHEKIITTNLENAYASYTVRILDPNVFPRSVVDVIAWKMASDMAIALRGDPKIQQACYTNFLAAFRMASGLDAREDSRQWPSDTSGQNPYLEARG